MPAYDTSARHEHLATEEMVTMAVQLTSLAAPNKEALTKFLQSCLALQVQIWILRCHRFTTRSGGEAVIYGHENERWQAMSD
jgi:hypothetical protein